MKVCLVSCTRAKLPRRAKARDLYDTPAFRRDREHAEREFDRWWVLSGKYGLLDPERVISPYDVSLNSMPRRQRRLWAVRVVEALLAETRRGDEITILANARYREDLVPLLEEAGRVVLERA
ncbi:MAG: DUF6884 domain-containing protein [Gemmatimonadota bacterium]